MKNKEKAYVTVISQVSHSFSQNLSRHKKISHIFHFIVPIITNGLFVQRQIIWAIQIIPTDSATYKNEVQ